MEKEHYKIKVLSNREVLNEIKYKVVQFPKGTKVELPILVIIIISFSLWYMITGNFLFGFTFLIMPVIFVLVFFFRMKMWVDQLIESQVELTGKEEVEGTIFFMDNEVKMINNLTGNKSNLKYECFLRLTETRNFYILHTKSLLYVAVNKDYFMVREEEEEKFLLFIKEKCSNIKFKK